MIFLCGPTSPQQVIKKDNVQFEEFSKCYIWNIYITANLKENVFLNM